MTSITHLRRRAFRDTSAREELPAQGGKGEAEEPPAAPRAGKLTSVPGSILVKLYGLFIFTLIVAYFSLLTAFLLSLFRIETWLFSQLWPMHAWWFIEVNLFFFLLFPITRLSLHLWRCLVGLVTPQNDDVPEKELGILLPADEHPALYAAVAEVGRRVHAPMPDEIRVTYKATCFAVELRNFAIRTDRKLVLVIGLPQIEVLTQSELAVIVAHELAHFGGGDTRLVVFLWRFVETLRLAHEEHKADSWRWIDPVTWLSWAYFHLLLVLSVPIQRHQEFRADGYSAAAYGGEFAARTLLKDLLLQTHFEASLKQFLHTIPHKSHDIHANIFRVFSDKFKDLTPEGEAYFVERLPRLRSSLWDSHPTLYERMENMRRYADRELPEAMPGYDLLAECWPLEKRLEEQLSAQQPAFPRNYM